MPVYQLHVAVALAVALLISATTYVLSGAKADEGKTALPTLPRYSETMV